MRYFYGSITYEYQYCVDFRYDSIDLKNPSGCFPCHEAWSEFHWPIYSRFIHMLCDAPMLMLRGRHVNYSYWITVHDCFWGCRKQINCALARTTLRSKGYTYSTTHKTATKRATCTSVTAHSPPSCVRTHTSRALLWSIYTRLHFQIQTQISNAGSDL